MERSIWRWLGPLVMTAVAAALFIAWWEKWPDPLIDAGRELYTAWRLSEGAVLYRDVAYFNGPLAPHLSALWFKLLGVGIKPLVWGNTLVLVAITALIWRLFTAMSGPRSATVAGLAFLAVFAFGCYDEISNYSYTLPYSHDATVGLLTSLLMLAALNRVLRGGGPTWLFSAGLAAGLTWLTKIELAVASSAALIAGLVLAGWMQRWNRVHALKSSALVIAGALCVIAAAFLLLLITTDAGTAWTAVTTVANIPGRGAVMDLLFYRWVMGVNEPAWRAAVMLGVAGGFAALTALLMLIARFTSSRAAAWITGLVLFLAVPLLPGVDWFTLAAGWPVVLIALAVLVITQLRRARNESAEPDSAASWALILTWLVFALVLLTKMILRVRIEHYGFVLAMPAGLAVAVGLIIWLPRALGPRGRIVAAGMLGVYLAVLGIYVETTLRQLDRKTAVVGEGVDRFYVLHDWQRLIGPWKDLDARLPREATVMVLPEGAMWNYLTRRVNPTPYVNFMPPELILFGEEKMIAALEQTPPDYIIAIGRPTIEYGLPVFGTDYGQKLWAAVRQRYTIEQVYEREPLRHDRFGVMVMKKARRDGGT